MKEHLRHGIEPIAFKPDFKEWFNDLPAFYRCGYEFDELHEKDKVYYDFLLRAYTSGKGIIQKKAVE
jgi:hypothetical protein